MTALVDLVASEATKVIVTSAVNGASKAGLLLFQLVGRKLGSIPEDPAKLRAEVLALVANDPDFGRELIEAVATLNGDQPVAVSTAAMQRFRDRSEFFADPPLAGICVLSGQSGVGKTELARQLASQVSAHFPAGRVEVDLADYRDGDELDVDAVKRFVLGCFGVPETEIPLDAARLDQHYLSAVVTRSFVLILDNALSAAEVEPFARFPGNLVFVTTANLTRDLRAIASRLITLRGLDDQGAREMLADHCGPVRLDLEPVEASRLLTLCGKMPFALREVGLTLAGRYGEPRPIAGLLAEYEATGVVDAESAIQDSLRRTFAALPAGSTRAAALLTAHPGDYFTRRTATALIGDAAVFDNLAGAQVFEQFGGWYRLTTLTRQYLRKIEADREPAFERLLGYIRDNVVAADLAGGERLRQYVVPNGLTWKLPESRIDWLEGHLGLIAELVKHAFWRGRYKEVCQLAGAIEVLVNSRGHWRKYAEISQWQVRAAEQQGKPALLARAYSMRAKAHFMARWFEPALADLEAATALVDKLDLAKPRNLRQKASVLEFWGRFHEERTDAGVVEKSDLVKADRCFREAVEIDRQLPDTRALGIHTRMSAGVLLKLGKPEEAKKVLEEARQYNSGRNLGRVWMGFVRVALALEDPGRARVHLNNARDELLRQGAKQYEWELRELEAKVRGAEGDIEGARAEWAGLVNSAFQIGHPRANEYLNELGRLPR